MVLDIQDIINSVSVPALIKDTFIKSGTFARLKNGDIQACVGGFSIVFPVDVDGTKWAFRCWHHTLDNDQARIKLLSTELKKVGLPYFIDFEYEDNGIVVNGAVYPTTRMKWISGRDIKDYICYNRNNRYKLFKLATDFFAMTQDLHRLSIAHGDLQYENIIVNRYGKIFLIDYDSMYVPALSYMNSKNSTNGKEGYQHPAREKCVNSNPKLDYFSEVVILTSILAIAYNPGLIDKYDMEDSDTMLFKKDDFRNFTSSGIYSELSSLGDPLVVLLNVLSSYLREQDITKLEPLELAVNKANPRCVIKIEDFLKNAEKEAEEKKAKEEEKRRQQELNAWRTASRNNTSTGYQVYLNKYPLGEHVQEAVKRIAECIEAEEEAKRLAAIKAEEEAWANACSYNTADSFSLFLRKYPNSKYKETATKRFEACKEAEEWKQAKASKTITRLDGFIKNYPNSIHVTEAKNILNQLKEARKWRQAKASNSITELEGYIKNYPDGVHVAEAKTIISELKEDNAWKTAQNIDTIESYKSYLSQYPNGLYDSIAKNKISEVKKSKGLRSILVSTAIIVIILLIIVIIAITAFEPNLLMPAVSILILIFIFLFLFIQIVTGFINSGRIDGCRILVGAAFLIIVFIMIAAVISDLYQVYFSKFLNVIFP